MLRGNDRKRAIAGRRAIAPASLIELLENRRLFSVTAAADTTLTAVGKAITVNLAQLNNQGLTTFVPSSVAVASNPADGTAAANGDGTITYTPNPSFLGADTFTYTISDTSGDVSTPATVTINVGLTISSTGSAHSLMASASNGAVFTVSISRGSALIGVGGTASASAPVKGVVTLTGSGNDLDAIQVSGTTSASILSISATGGTVNLASVSGSSPLKEIAAPDVNLTGNLQLPSLGSLEVQQLNNANVLIQPSTSNSLTISAPQGIDSSTFALAKRSVTLTTSFFNNSTISAGDIDKFAAPGGIDNSSISDAGKTNIDFTAGAISNSTIVADQAAVMLSSGAWDGDAFESRGLKNSAIDGAVNNSTLNTSTGDQGNLSIGGAITNSAIACESALATFSCGAISGSTIAAESVANFKAGGDLSQSSLSLGRAKGSQTAVGNLAVSGQINGSDVSVGGNVHSLQASSVSGSQISAGTEDSASNATPSTLGTATISAVKIAGSFANSTLIAHTILSQSIGSIDTNAAPAAIAAAVFGTTNANVDGEQFRLSRAQLKTQSKVDTALGSVGGGSETINGQPSNCFVVVA